MNLLTRKHPKLIMRAKEATPGQPAKMLIGLKTGIVIHTGQTLRWEPVVGAQDGGQEMKTPTWRQLPVPMIVLSVA